MKLGCIIVTYNPKPEIFQRELAALYFDQAIDRLVIVDNGSGPSTLALLNSAAEQDSRIELILLGDNFGIAAAQNRGVECARSNNCHLLLFLDHDSIPSPGLISGMKKMMIVAIARGERIAAIGARTIDPRSGQEHGFAVLRKGIWRRLYCSSNCTDPVPCEFLNASGSLIYLASWDEIGPFNELFFIDHVETEWYMRARHKQFLAYGYCNGYLEHLMGDEVVRFWFLKWHQMPRRSPDRHYTIIRNSIWMYKLPHTPFTWTINNFAKLLFTFIYFSIADTEKIHQFKKMLLGIMHGLHPPSRLPPPASPQKN